MTDENSAPKTVTRPQLITFYEKLLSRQGVYPAAAEATAESMAITDLHSLDRAAESNSNAESGSPAEPSIVGLIDSVMMGDVDPRASTIALLETPTAIILDGSGGLGSAVLSTAVEETIEKALTLGVGIAYVQRCKGVPSSVHALKPVWQANLTATLVTSNTGSPANSAIRLDQAGGISVHPGIKSFWEVLKSRYTDGTDPELDSLTNQVAILLRAAKAAQRIGRLTSRVGPVGQEFCLVVEDGGEDGSGLIEWDGLFEERLEDESLSQMLQERAAILKQDLTEDGTPQHWTLPAEFVEPLEKLSKRHRIPLPWGD